MNKIASLRPVRALAGNLGLWLIRFMMVAYGASLVGSLIPMISGQGKSQDLSQIVMAIVQIAVMIFAERDVRAGRQGRAGGLIIGSILVSLIITQWISPTGGGWLIGPLIMLSLSVIASVLLPARQVTAGITAVVTGGIVIVLEDVLLGHVNFVLDQPVSTTFIEYGAAIAFAAVIVFRYKQFPVAAKLLILSVGFGLVTAIGMVTGAGMVLHNASFSLPAEVVMHVESNLLVAASVSILVGCGVALLASRLITEPLGEMVRTSEKIAAIELTRLSQASVAIARGDLTQSIHIDTQSIEHQSADELGDLARAFNQMIVHLHETGDAFYGMTTNLRQLVGQVAGNANDLGSASSQLAAVANQAGQATSQIATTIQQVAGGTTQQSDSITRTATSVEQMSRVIDGVAKGAQEQAQAVAQSSIVLSQLSDAVNTIRQGAQEQSEGMQHALSEATRLASALKQVDTLTEAVSSQTSQVAETATNGTRFASQSVQGIQRLQETTQHLGQRVHDLGKRSAQIGAIVETIDDIAAQTNLLALNAAIEAARAGEHGKGFAVVADEVRKLAERSASATKEITEMIGMVQSGASDVVEAMKRAGEDVSTAADLTEQAGVSFQTIAEGAQLSVTQMSEARRAVEAMRAGGVELEKAVIDAGQIAQRNQSASAAMGRPQWRDGLQPRQSLCRG